jgi:hypothetical protein
MELLVWNISFVILLQQMVVLLGLVRFQIKVPTKIRPENRPDAGKKALQVKP